MEDLRNRIMQYANDNPVKFAALSSFCILGAVPLVAFLAYSVATIIASLVGAVVIELVLLAVGITVLAFVLFFVTCISVCITSVFAAVYFTYKAASTTLHKGKNLRLRTPVWPFSNAEPQSDHETSEADKKK